MEKQKTRNSQPTNHIKAVKGLHCLTVSTLVKQIYILCGARAHRRKVLQEIFNTWNWRPSLLLSLLTQVDDCQE
jgi:hypothetical protein